MHHLIILGGLTSFVVVNSHSGSVFPDEPFYS